jgi:CheY-like chemotaxis protein
LARILVIDDEEVVRDLLTAVLGEAGHEVTTAEDGAAGVARYREQACDLVITDILMPVMDGLEVIRELRGQGATVGIMATAAVGDRALDDARLAGADKTLPKPFSIDHLLDEVSRLLGREA